MGMLTTLLTQLQALIPAKLLDDDPLMEDNWNKTVDFTGKALEILQTVDEKMRPIGSIYIQFPGLSTPATLFPGETWANVTTSDPALYGVNGTYAGRFFRAENGNAATFGSMQDDAIRNITGSAEYKNRSRIRPNGAFYLGTKIGAGQNFWGGEDNASIYSLDFDASLVVPTAPENRPQNATMRIWKRTA